MKKPGVMLLAGLVIAAGASAQEKNDGAVYTGVEGAYMVPSSGAPLSSGFHMTSHSTGVAAWRWLLGVEFNRYLGLEFAYFRTAGYQQAASNGVIKARGRLSANGEDLSLLYHFSDSFPGLFVKGGMSHASLDTSVTTVTPLASATRAYTTSGNGYLMGLGYDFKLNQALTARLGYSRYLRVAGQDNIKLHVFSAGVTYRF